MAQVHAILANDNYRDAKPRPLLLEQLAVTTLCLISSRGMMNAQSSSDARCRSGRSIQMGRPAGADGTFNLIHVPLNLYPVFLQPILRVLLPASQKLNLSRDSPDLELHGLTIDSQHGFLNISISPVECSILCHSSWVQAVFEPAIKALPKDAAKTVIVSRDSYLILSVISAGLDAAGRVMELSSPLALAGIPIFFITTYYSDFILVPTKERHNVIQALLAKGFELSENQSSFVNPSAYGHQRSSSQPTSPPRTPPPSNVTELQTRTFELLRKRSVIPYIEDGLELVQCSGRETSQLEDVFTHRPSISRQMTGNGHRETWVDRIDSKLYTCMIAALVSKPSFMSITLAQDDPPSLLLDKKLLPIFGDSLVGDTEGRLIPIFLDLVNLPLEATGIVCGVAGRLVQDMNMTESSELSYLSTARAGAVILSDAQSTRALEILKPLLTKEA
ncbi:hypothetical protein HJFPF1_11377 [Paramyrothecium foliicola]|nr:hypothetical protein HJFPF1_11377 [Paramyrothecium foliicola]